MDLLYIQEIPNTSWVLETISEKFDGAINMMTENTVIYGGAVRDCIAGKKLMGDLDFLVSFKDYVTLTNKFVKDPKWVSVKQTSSYQQLYTGPHLTSFQTLDNKIVQIIPISFVKNETYFQTVLHFIKRVDIVCCSMILTNEGKVFEIIPNAYEECKKNILTLNASSNITNLKRFQSRVKKFVSRGWINNIDMNRLITKLKRKHRQSDKHSKLDFKYSSLISNKDDITSVSNTTVTMSNML